MSNRSRNDRERESWKISKTIELKNNEKFFKRKKGKKRPHLLFTLRFFIIKLFCCFFGLKFTSSSSSFLISQFNGSDLIKIRKSFPLAAWHFNKRDYINPPFFYVIVIVWVITQLHIFAKCHCCYNCLNLWKIHNVHHLPHRQ